MNVDITDLAQCDEHDPQKMRQMSACFGPLQVDSQIRQAIQFCWMLLPPDRKNVASVEQEFRRLVDRALKDLREDFESFGLSTS